VNDSLDLSQLYLVPVSIKHKHDILCIIRQALDFSIFQLDFRSKAVRAAGRPNTTTASGSIHDCLLKLIYGRLQKFILLPLLSDEKNAAK